MVEMNPQDSDIDNEVSIYVAQTTGTDENSDKVLLNDDYWFTFGVYTEERIASMVASGEITEDQTPDGTLIVGEMHNLTKEQTIAALEMVLDTLRTGEEITTEMEATE